MSSLTIAYITSRKDPKIEWFFDSLGKQQLKDWHYNIIVVTRDTEPNSPIGESLFLEIECDFRYLNRTITVVPPKPNVWQGQYRLTKEDWFAAANARNTALCLCETDWIAYVDDLSVLMPEWLSRVEAAMEGGYNVAGSYRKVKELLVEDGKVKWHIPYSDDVRLSIQKEWLSDCDGGWLYGCSCALKVEDLLDVGGWPEICDGIGSEDYCLGLCLKNAGKSLKYDKNMMTYESEEDHTKEPALARTDKGKSPNDKSHALLNIAKASRYYSNYYEGGMRALREHVLAGNSFPIIKAPEHDWYDGEPISEMTPTPKPR